MKKILQVLGVILAFTCFISSPALAQTEFGWTATNSDAVNTTIGEVPAGAFPAGISSNTSVSDRHLYACRGEYKNSIQPGKLWKSWCHIGWGGKEVLLNEYEVLVTAPGNMNLIWLFSGTGEPKPANLVYGGYNDMSEGYGGYPLDICRTAYKGGVHPGKLWKDMCHIGWGGKEVYLKDYQVLTLDANL